MAVYVSASIQRFYIEQCLYSLSFPEQFKKLVQIYHTHDIYEVICVDFERKQNITNKIGFIYIYYAVCMYLLYKEEIKTTTTTTATHT